MIPNADSWMKEKKMKWLLIANRSSQQKTQQIEKSPSRQEGEFVKELNHPRDNASAAIEMTATTENQAPHSLLILLFIGIIFYLFGYLNECELGKNDIFYDLNNAFESEKLNENAFENSNCDIFVSGLLCPIPTPSPQQPPQIISVVEIIFGIFLECIC